jgi:hypothetical protein
MPMTKHSPLTYLFLGFLLVACVPGVNNSLNPANRGLIEQLPIKITDNTEVTIASGQTIYLLSTTGFRDADGGYTNICHDLSVNSSKDKTDLVTLEYSSEAVVLNVRLVDVRLYEDDVLLCGGKTILTMNVRDGVKPGVYKVITPLKIEDGEENGEVELSFNVRVVESAS